MEFELKPTTNSVLCRATAECTGQTGVEMEALSTLSLALLTIYDTCKAVDRGMVMGGVRLMEKRGGRVGTSWPVQMPVEKLARLYSPLREFIHGGGLV